MKKEIIQFFKSKTNVIAMLIFPIVLIFVMGKSLDGLMSMDKNIFSGKIIYFNIEDSSGNKNLQPFYDFSVQFQKDTEAEFVENTNPEEAIKLVNKNEAICFINVCKDDIKYFRNENGEVIVSSSANVGINTIGSMTLTLLDAQKIKDSETIVEELKFLIDDVLAMSDKYLN